MKPVMSLKGDTIDPTQSQAGSRVLFGKALMLIDTLWGALAFLGGVLIIGPSHAGGRESLLDLALAISLVAGLPAYVLDSRSRRRIIVFLPALYLFRWYVGSHIGPPPYDLSPP